MSARPGSPHHVWRVPLLLAAVTVSGLVAGLLEDGAWDLVAAAALALPLAVALWYALKPAQSPH